MIKPETVKIQLCISFFLIKEIGAMLYEDGDLAAPLELRPLSFEIHNVLFPYQGRIIHMPRMREHEV